MNKEVNYVLQGFLLTLLVVGAFKVTGFLLSIPPPQSSLPEIENRVITTADPQKKGTSGIGIDGRMLFMNNCASCHSVFKDMTGPALMGVQDRIKDRKLMNAWIRNPQSVLKKGNPYFKRLVQRFDNTMMTPFPSLSDDEITAIFEYIGTTQARERVMPLQAVCQ